MPVPFLCGVMRGNPMKPIEIAQRLAQLNEPESAVRAYKMALEESVGADPTTEMEAAAYILQFGKGRPFTRPTCG